MVPGGEALHETSFLGSRDAREGGGKPALQGGQLFFARREDVAVRVRGTHLCMSMRGVRMDAALTTTLQVGGRFKSDPVLSQQFLTLAAAQ